ncbi:MAG TPA: ABC transporter ATP-binding protein [Planctomycetes bacterium]|nr:ABC transporter ATP-binding protein [Planctomycetota bacterium]
MKNRLGNTWRLLSCHVRPQIPGFALVVLLGTITASTQALSLGLFAGVWKVIFVEQKTAGAGEVEQSFLTSSLDRLEAFSRASGPFEDWKLSMLVWLSLIALVLALAAGISQWGYTLISRRIAYRMIVDLRIRVARHLMGLSMHYHGRRHFGDLLSRISSDVTQTLAAVNLAMRSLILEPIKALTVMILMLATAPLVTVGVLITLPIALWPVARLMRSVKKGSRKSLTSLGTSVQALSQMFQGIRTVKAFGGEERELARYRELNESYLKVSMRMVKAIALSHSWTAFYSIAGIGVLVLAIGTIELMWHPFQEGGVMAAWFLMVARLNNHVKNTTKAYTKFGEAAGGAERILEILNEKVDVVEADDPVHVDRLDREIRLEGVRFTYPDGETPALDGIDLTIEKGQTLALVGPSGSGKSTLLDLVARFLDPTEGRVLVDGVDLREIAVADWTSLYAMVSQAPFLFHSTVAENIAYGKEGATQEEIEAAARAADIHEFIEGLPEGYRTNVADMGSRLSGGQRQRITIARALLKKAPLLLLDEATSALDSESEREVQDALDRLMQDRTVIVIAHRLATVRRADRICVLEHGRLVESGRHEELIEKGGVYARLHALQNLAPEGDGPIAARG